LVNVDGCDKKSKHLCKYLELSSANRPVSHSDEIPKLVVSTKLPDTYQEVTLSESSMDNEDSVDEDFSHPALQLEPSLFDQAELNDLICDLYLSKKSSELLASRLHDKHLLKLTANTTVS